MYIAHLQTKARTAEKAAAAAQAQTVVSDATAQAIDRLVIQERTITREVQNVVREIDALPTGEALVPDDVAAAWADGVDGLRQHTGEPDGDDSGKPEGLPRE
jgi:alkyl hydroperoxide reductase subunit AhpC